MIFDRQIQGFIVGRIRPAMMVAEFSKWLEAGEENILSAGKEKNLSGASYDLPEAAARLENPQK